MPIHERLGRVLEDLEAITNDLEARGFERQMSELDAAAGKIQEIADDFEELLTT